MNRTDRFDDIVSDWLHADADHRVPEHLDAVLLRTRTGRQRPAWSSLERWLPMQTTLRLAPVPRVAWLLLVVGLVAAVALAALAVGSRHHQPAPPFGLARNGPIVYGGTDNDIYTLDPVTGATTVLIADTAGDQRPLLAPDGTRLLFLRDSATREQGVGFFLPMMMVANDDGSDVRALTGPLANFGGYVGNVAWSHDGRKVAVISDVDSKPAIQVFTVDGSSPRVVIDTHLLTDIDYLAFRPGDRELTFRGVTPASTGLFAVGPDGNGYRTIAELTEGDGASLSPDGRKIAYQAWDGTTGVIHVVDVDTGLDTVPALDPPSTTLNIDDKPTWSPDGTRFLFVRYHLGDINHLAVAPVAGGHVVEIGPAMPNAAKAVYAEFSPDGSKVLASYDADGSTWLLDPTGSTPGTKLSSTIAKTATWQRLAP